MGHRIHELKASGRCLESIDAINQGKTKGSKKWDKTLVNESGKAKKKKIWEKTSRPTKRIVSGL